MAPVRAPYEGIHEPVVELRAAIAVSSCTACSREALFGMVDCSSLRVGVRDGDLPRANSGISFPFSPRG